jgi:hypothetical protein
MNHAAEPVASPFSQGGEQLPGNNADCAEGGSLPMFNADPEPTLSAD